MTLIVIFFLDSVHVVIAMRKGDFGAICVGIGMLITIICIGSSLSGGPESSQSKCEKKGGIWYTPRSAEYICLDRKVIINLGD